MSRLSWRPDADPWGVSVSILPCKTSANCKLWDCLFFPTQLCHINSQWALDYKSLTQPMSANSTGNYSIPSFSSSYHRISVCTRCPQMERQLEESNREICQLTAKLEKPQRTIEQKSQEVENENWCQVGIANRVRIQAIYSLPWLSRLGQTVKLVVHSLCSRLWSKLYGSL